MEVMQFKPTWGRHLCSWFFCEQQAMSIFRRPALYENWMREASSSHHGCDPRYLLCTLMTHISRNEVQPQDLYKKKKVDMNKTSFTYTAKCFAGTRFSNKSSLASRTRSGVNDDKTEKTTRTQRRSTLWSQE